jgi:hypothetical protein
MFSLTLKQTQSEKGRVTTTSPHEMAVSNQPQNPIPLWLSSAETQGHGVTHCSSDFLNADNHVVNEDKNK